MHSEKLYIIQEGNNLIYKIGRSCNINDRIKNLQTANPNKLKLINSFECENCPILETEIHNHLKMINK